MCDYEIQTPIWLGYSEPNQESMYKCPYCGEVIEGSVLAAQHYVKHEKNCCPNCERLLKMEWMEVE